MHGTDARLQLRQHNSGENLTQPEIVFAMDVLVRQQIEILQKDFAPLPLCIRDRQPSLTSPHLAVRKATPQLAVGALFLVQHTPSLSMRNLILIVMMVVVMMVMVVMVPLMLSGFFSRLSFSRLSFRVRRRLRLRRLSRWLVLCQRRNKGDRGGNRCRGQELTEHSSFPLGWVSPCSPKCRTPHERSLNVEIASLMSFDSAA